MARKKLSEITDNLDTDGGDFNPASVYTSKDVQKIRERLKHNTTEPATVYWIQTDEPELNKVFGSEEQGIPAGKIFEVAGMESNGKTALMLAIASCLQADGIQVIWIDLENSFDPVWASKFGIDCTKLTLLQYYVGTFGSKEPRLITIQELLSEAEALIKMYHKQHKKIAVVVDSVAVMLTGEEQDTALEEQNMRTKLSLATFMSALTRKWLPYAMGYGVSIFFINQLRLKPGVMYGDPQYTTGGKALDFAASIRVRMNRVGNGQIKDKNGKVIGIRGVITNKKNKAGGECREGEQCGYKIFYSGKVEFMSVKAVKEKDDDE